jgi:hypothetical protein
MNRVVAALLVLVLTAVAAAWLASPLWTFEQLKDAARAGDQERLEALVDFPAVRDNLKKQVDSRAVKLAREASGVGMPAVMALGKLGAMIGDRAVDRLVTPEAITLIVNRGRNPRLNWSNDDPPPRADARPEVRYAYLSPDRFRVALSPPDRPETSVALIMERRGLFTWRVEELELPK